MAASSWEQADISIHALREEGDDFQHVQGSCLLYFYPRPPRGGRLQEQRQPHRPRRISIHALREVGDSSSVVRPARWTDFYPRPPRGGRRLRDKVYSLTEGISIHALREEGDSCRVRCWSLRLYFYPRPPRGGRLDDTAAGRFALRFLSTPSARRATPTCWALVPFA